jgi:hypothetical protein
MRHIPAVAVLCMSLGSTCPLLAASETESSQTQVISVSKSVSKLHDQLPANALAYLRIPDFWSLLTTSEPDILHSVTGHPAYAKTMQMLSQSVDEKLIQKLSSMTHPGLSLLLSHVHAPIEAALLLPENVPPTATYLVISTKLDFASMDALNLFMTEISTATPGMEIHAEFSAQKKAVFSMIQLGISMVGDYNTDTRTLTLLSALGATPDSFDRVIGNLKATPSHPMRKLESQTDQSKRGFFHWINIARLWKMIRSEIPSNQAEIMEEWGVFDLRAIALGWGKANGKGRLRLMLDMPKAGYRAQLPDMNNPLDFAVSGQANIVFGLALPMRALLELTENLVQAQISEELWSQYQELKQSVREATGLEFREIAQALGEEMVFFNDEAGNFGAIRIKPSPEQDKFFEFIRHHIAGAYETRTLDGITYHHLTIPSLNPWQYKPTAMSGGLEIWLRSLVEKISAHYYWMREGDYVVFAELPQQLIDRQNHPQRTPMRKWLQQERGQDFGQSLLYLSVNTWNTPTYLYYAHLAVLQILSDITDTPFDPFAFPTARELKLSPFGAYGFQMDMADDLVALGLSFEEHPFEFMYNTDIIVATAVAGIVAAVAIPAYTDYLKRSKTAEALMLLGSLKTPAEEFLLSQGRLPAVAEIGGKTEGKYTKNIRLREEKDGYEAMFKDSNMPGKLLLLYDPLTEMWQCSSEGMDETMLPASCR